MLKNDWEFGAENLGDALFDYVEIETHELEQCGVLHAEPRILAALRVEKFEVEGLEVSAVVSLVFQLIGIEAQEAKTEIEVVCARDSSPFLKIIGNQVCSAYESARAILLARAPSQS